METAQDFLNRALPLLQRSDPIPKLLPQVRLGRMPRDSPALQAIISSWLEAFVTVLKDGESVISIMLSKGATTHITHNITQPTHVRLEQTESGADMALQIESGDRATTLVRFRSAMLPEMVDGIVSE